jgi:hypothetical protein
MGSPPEEENRREVEGRYANYFQVGFNDAEFLLDFGQQYGESEPKVHTRVITSPAYIGAFMDLLAASLSKYRQQYPKDSEQGD